MKQKIETRRMLLFLPLLIIPLLAIAFYALGGGKKSMAADQPKQAGINTTLPDARFTRDTLTDKMSVYDQLKKSGNDTSSSEIEAVAGRLGFNGLPEDPQAKAIADKLAALNKEMAKADEAKTTEVATGKSNVADPAIQKDVAKLEMLMKSMQSGSGEDPEMKQLWAMLQSIQEIQNPDLAKLKYKNTIPTAAPDSQSV